VRPASPIAPAHAQGRRRCPVLPHRHLLGIEGLSPDDIHQFLDLADGYVELNRQADKKRSTLRGRTIINCFSKARRAPAPFELAGKRLGGDVINISVPTSSMVKSETLIDKPDALIMHPGPMNRGVEIAAKSPTTSTAA
jgi:aspartate carbamoyltransferase catalytic subunit